MTILHAMQSASDPDSLYLGTGTVLAQRVRSWNDVRRARLILVGSSSDVRTANVAVPYDLAPPLTLHAAARATRDFRAAEPAGLREIDLDRDD